MISFFNISVLTFRYQCPVNYIKMLLLAFVTFFFSGVQAQDLDIESIEKAKPIKVSGAVSMLNRFYAANGIADRQDPYIWTLHGNLNFDIFGIAVPLSGTLTSQNKSFNQPYNRLSIRPRYKWAKAYIGYSNMTFSSYTLAGHTFLGSGIELKPNKIRVSANYGRFAAAIPIDKPVNRPFVPAFTRIGYGTKIGYGTDENFIDLILFKGADDENSWDAIPDSTNVFPGENMVVGTAWRLSLVKNLSLSGEFARSAYTRDKRDEIIGNEAVFSSFGFDSKSSTTVRNAFKLSAQYKIGGSNINGTFERIDPEYQTMGAYFFNNDIENITAGVTTNFLKKRLFLTINGGLQRNNLEGTEVSTSSRTIVSGNLMYVKSPLTLGLTHSNYSSDIEFVLNSNLDSLNAVVVTRATTLSGTYVLKKSATNTQVVTTALTRQAVTNDFSGQRGSENSNMNGVLSYTLGYPVMNINFIAKINYNRNDLDGVINERIGPGVTVKKLFLDRRMSAQLSVNYFNQEGNSTTNYILRSSLKIKSHHIASISASRVSRFMKSNAEGSSNKFGETIIAINYTCTF